MKSVFANGTRLREALAQPGAEDAAVRQAEQRLHDLVALVVGVGPRVQPDLHPQPHVPEGEIAEHCCQCEQAGDDVIEDFITENSSNIMNINFLYSYLENLEFKFIETRNKDINYVTAKFRELNITR